MHRFKPPFPLIDDVVDSFCSGHRCDWITSLSAETIDPLASNHRLSGVAEYDGITYQYSLETADVNSLTWEPIDYPNVKHLYNELILPLFLNNDVSEICAAIEYMCPTINTYTTEDRSSVFAWNFTNVLPTDWVHLKCDETTSLFLYTHPETVLNCISRCKH